MTEAKRPGAQIQDVREMLIDRTLVVLSVVAVPALAASLWRLQAIGWLPVMGLHMAAAAVIWTTTLCRRRLSYAWRTWTVIGLFYLIGVGGFLNLALSGAGYPFLLLSVVLAAAFLGLRGGLVMVVLGGIAIAAVGAGYATRALDPQFDLGAYNTQAEAWATALFGFLLLAGGAVSVVAGLSGRLLDAMAALREKSERLTHEVEAREEELARAIIGRQHVEETLDQSEDRFRLIVDMQSEVITRFTPDGEMTFVNRAYCEFVDKPESELVGTSIYEDIPKEERARIKAYFDEFTPATPVRKNENRLMRADGQMRDFEWSNFALFDNDGKVVRFQSVGRDVTEKKQIEAALIASEARYQSVVDGQGELITRFLADGRFTFVNAAYCRFVGRAEGDILAGTIFDDVAEADVARLKTYLSRFSVDEPIQHIENQVRRHDGEDRTLQWQDTAFFDDEGELVEFQSVARDVTEARRAQAALEVATVEAQAANVAKSDFLATMSHEIRTPISGILGLADMLVDGGLTDEQNQLVARIKRAGLSLVGILNDILDLSKIQAGKMDIETIEFDLGKLISDSLDLFYPKASEKGIALGSKVDADLPATVIGDPNRIKQVLINLIGNAVKFTETGSVTLRVSASAGTGDTAELRFEVIDTGIGIAEDRREDLFQDFTQADPSTARKYEGTGLGLAISKRLVELMDGAMGGDSTLGKGSTFWLSVPVRVSANTPISARSAPETTVFRARRALRILLAEDNDLNQMIIQASLAKFDHQITAVDNGQAAVEAVRDGDFDLVLMDVRMPELDGPDATRIIRAEESAKARIPIIAVTADALVENIETYTDAGMDACVTKPIDRAELVQAINQVLGEEVHVAVDPDDRPA